MIEIDQLQKEYNNDLVLDIPGLQIPRSECFGLVGNNGAGKTTLFRLILDLIQPTNGQVLIEQVNVQSTEEWKKRVGSYLDKHMLLSYLTADEYFKVLQDIYGLSKQDKELHLQKFEDLFNGEIRGNKKYIRELSKGNRKKVGIASAMMGHKDIIVLDEPFEGLDPRSQNQLKKIIAEEREQNQITFLISSHDLTHVTDVCNRIVLLEKGQIIKDLKEEKEQMTAELSDYFTV
jgi:ABC-2 type transport system ATP-binding protein